MVARVRNKTKEVTVTSMGRPTPYRPEFSTEIRELCKLGATDRDIALHFNVTTQTIRNWREKHPEFFIEVLQGKQSADVKMASCLYRNGNGFYYYEEQLVKKWHKDYDKEGHVTHAYEVVETMQVKRYCKPDTTAQIFWLKNRRPDLWRDAHLITAEQTAALPGDEAKKYEGAELQAEVKKRGLIAIVDVEFTVVRDVSPAS